MPLTEITKLAHHIEAWQCSWQNRASDLQGMEWRVNLHMRTDAKNLETTARTIHLPEQKETIHMISMLLTEASSGSIHDVAHIPTPNCLADWLTKASAKADNLITAVQTGNIA